MRIIEAKTTVMTVGKGRNEQMQINIDGQVLEQIRQCKYLGSLLTQDGRSKKEVNRHGQRYVQQASIAAHGKNQLQAEEEINEHLSLECSLQPRKLNAEEG